MKKFMDTMKQYEKKCQNFFSDNFPVVLKLEVPKKYPEGTLRKITEKLIAELKLGTVGYISKDEINIIIQDINKVRIQKLVSQSAAIATGHLQTFNNDETIFSSSAFSVFLRNLPYYISRKTNDSKMTIFEKNAQEFLNPEKSFIIRLDQVDFKSYSKKIKHQEPYDLKYMQAIDAVGLAITQHFPEAKFAYFQTDEINIIVKPSSKNPFEYPIQDIVSKSAAIATIILMQHYPDIPTAFDSRVFSIESNDILRYLDWRQILCRSNSTIKYSQHIFGTHYTHKKKCRELRQDLKDYGNDWYHLPSKIRRGRVFGLQNTNWKKIEHIPLFKGWKGNSFLKEFI